MVTTLKISDEVYQEYVEHNKTNPRLAMEQQLKRFAKLAPNDRALILSNQGRKELEALAGVTFEDEAALLKFVKDRLTFNAEGANVTMRPGQLRHILQEASAMRQDPAVYIEKKVKQALDSAYGLY